MQAQAIAKVVSVLVLAAAVTRQVPRESEKPVSHWRSPEQEVESRLGQENLLLRPGIEQETLDCSGQPEPQVFSLPATLV